MQIKPHQEKNLALVFHYLQAEILTPWYGIQEPHDLLTTYLTGLILRPLVFSTPHTTHYTHTHTHTHTHIRRAYKRLLL